MTAILIAALLLGAPIDDRPQRAGISGTATGDVSLPDDIALKLGSSDDYWIEYDSTDTRWEFWTSDSNGAGLDAMIAYVEDGTNDWTFAGDADLAGGRLYADLLGGTATPMYLYDCGGTGGDLCFVRGAVEIARFLSGGLRLGGSQVLYWPSATELNGSTNGTFLMLKSGGAEGIKFDFTTPGIVTLSDESGGGIELRLSRLTGIDSSSFQFITGAIPYLRMRSSMEFRWSSTVSYGGTPDTVLDRDSEGRLGLEAGTKGALSTTGYATETLTFAANPGDASKTTSGLIPDGAWLKAVNTRVITAGTGCADIDIGDGSTVDLYAANSSVADATTTTNANATASFGNPQLTSTGPHEVTVTGTDGLGGAANCIDLVIRVEVWYETFAASTSD